MTQRPKLRGADLFCGGGGFTTGAIQSGYVDMRLAVNHWRTAILTHQENHPTVRHICARIDDIDPRHDATLPACDLLLASPECTHHSIARGGRPIDDQKRATPWHVCAWAEAKRPRWIIVENVREFRDWGPLGANGRPLKSRKGETFAAWLRSIESLGYQVDHQLLNAADFGAATRRVRLFIVARRGRSRRAIPWPEPTHARDAWRPAWEIIDWAKPCPSIFARKRPLADKTLARIELGLRKFVGQAAEPFCVRLRSSRGGLGKGGTLHGLADPLGTITAGGKHHALAIPFQFKAIGRNPGASKPITDPLPTIVAARENHAVVVPFLAQYHNGRDGDRRTYSPADPIGTLDTQNRYSLVVPFLTKYYGTGRPAGVDAPLDTVTARDRFGLAMARLVETMRELHVVDVGFRMLDDDELAAAQGFPAGYYLHGTKADRVRQIGNSVSPPVARALCATVAEAA